MFSCLSVHFEESSLHYHVYNVKVLLVGIITIFVHVFLRFEIFNFLKIAKKMSYVFYLNIGMSAIYFVANKNIAFVALDKTVVLKIIKFVLRHFSQDILLIAVLLHSNYHYNR